MIASTHDDYHSDFTSVSKTMLNLTGREFGRLTVLGYVGRKKWRCRCQCGNTNDILGNSLTRENGTQSCGCLFREVVSRGVRERSTTHGMTKTRTWKTWSMMIQRCHNQNAPDYPRYGARGVTVCLRWRLSFEDFLADMGERPDGKTLDRFPMQDGNYEPGNCRWATPEEQQRNKRTNRLVTFNGETLCVAEWAERIGIPAGTLIGRLRNGWSDERAITEPLSRAHSHSKGVANV